MVYDVSGYQPDKNLLTPTGYFITEYPEFKKTRKKHEKDRIL